MWKILSVFFKSLRFRIWVLLMIFGIVPGFILRAGVLYTYQNHAISQRETEIASQFQILSPQIIRNRYLEDPSMNTLTAQIEQVGTLYRARVILINSSFHIVKDTYNMDSGKYMVSDVVTTAWKNQTTEEAVHDSSRGKKQIEIGIPMIDNASQKIYGVIYVSTTTNFMTADLNQLKQILSILQMISIVVVIVTGFILSNILVRPLGHLTNSISAVKDGYEEDFKRINTYSETDAMSKACNDMLSRMQTLDQSRQEFVSNVSHELKTPLTSMKVLADSLVGQDNVPVEIYREFMNDIAGEIDRENKIINDLLSLVRLDKSKAALNISSVNINDMLGLLMKRLKPIAEKQNVDLVLESFRPVNAEVDEVKMTLALSNLIENAIKYNKPEGSVKVSLNADHQNFFVNVSDTGIGIPEESQSHIFERFYRVDKSHSRAIGGTGLGLSITRNIIIMHKGAIKVHSVEGEGTTFTVRIPLIYVANTER